MFYQFPSRELAYLFPYTWYWLHDFPPMTSLTCFPLLDTGYMFSNTWIGFHVFLSLTLVTCFPAHDLPCLVLKHVPSICHLSTCYMLCRWSHVLLTELNSTYFTFLVFLGLIHCANCCCAVIGWPNVSILEFASWNNLSLLRVKI